MLTAENETYWDVVSSQIPVAFLSVELDGKATNITQACKLVYKSSRKYTLTERSAATCQAVC